VNEFTRYIRVHAADIATQGMATFDFSTMCTSFEQATICKNVMVAFNEAQLFEASRCPDGSDLPNMTLGGWVFGDGWSFVDVEKMLQYSMATA
jgi:hypothetical protein